LREVFVALCRVFKSSQRSISDRHGGMLGVKKMSSGIYSVGDASMTKRGAWRGMILTGLVLAAVLSAGCSTRSVRVNAPVEDRMKSSGATSVANTVAPKILPGAENAGKPGYFMVRPGDNLYRIAIEHGQSARDVQAWNGLANPNMIEVGQVLRVTPPPGMSPSAAPATVTTATAAVVVPAGVVARPLNAPAVVQPATPAPAPAQMPAAPPVKAGDEVQFIWPARGSVIAQFDEAKNKGVSIGGRVGEPVLAAADGRVVYAGAGLRGYGNLIILKHNDTFLTAYAHNQALLVREDQAVKQGQRIAEMGSSDADRVKLHFEVRRDGKPVDPMQYLPKQN
jgi:lipoprotein NlpD